MITGSSARNPAAGLMYAVSSSVRELGFRLVEAVQPQRGHARVAVRLLAGRVDLEPAFGRQRGLLQLEVVERDARRLLGDRLVVEMLGGRDDTPARPPDRSPRSSAASASASRASGSAGAAPPPGRTPAEGPQAARNEQTP